MRTTKTAEEIKAMVKENDNNVIATPLSEVDVMVLFWDVPALHAFFEALGPGDAIVVRREIRPLKEPTISSSDRILRSCCDFIEKVG